MPKLVDVIIVNGGHLAKTLCFFYMIFNPETRQFWGHSGASNTTPTRPHSQQPTPNSQQPTTSSQQPTHNNQLPTVNSQLPTANSQLPTAKMQTLSAVSCQLFIFRSQQLTANSQASNQAVVFGSRGLVWAGGDLRVAHRIQS